MVSGGWDVQPTDEGRQFALEWMNAIRGWLPETEFDNITAETPGKLSASSKKIKVTHKDPPKTSKFSNPTPFWESNECSDGPWISETNSRTPDSSAVSSTSLADNVSASDELICWDHGCNGRKFSTRSNFVRHQRERSGARGQFCCPRCTAVFSRTTARNEHVKNGSCGRIRRYSNGRERPSGL